MKKSPLRQAIVLGVAHLIMTGRLLAQKFPAVNPNSSANQGPSEDGDHEQSHCCQPDIIRVVLFDDIGTN